MGVTDTMLESRKRKRRVMLSTQHFLFVPEVVARTDLVAIVPARLQIDAQSITVAGQTFQTFPSIDRRLFPGLSTPC